MADTTVLVKGEGWKVKAAIGLGGIIAIIALAFMYRFQVGIAVLVIGLGVGARVGVWAWHQYKLAGFEQRRWLADVKLKEYEADRARILRHFLEFNAGVFHIEHPDEAVGVRKFYPAVRASQQFADAPALLPEPEPRLRRLLDVKYEHMLIVGPSGSGKTTALCHLIENAPPNALVYVLDPHAQFSQWPERVNQVVGIGRDYEAINTRLAELITIMDRRYNGLEPVTQKVLIVADEWLIIRDKCSNAERFFTEVGSEARKVNLSLIISSISSILDDLYVSGAIRDNFAQLALNRTLKDKNQGELIWSRKDKELVELPGPYIHRAAFAPARAVTEPMPIQEAVEPLPVLDAGPVPPVPDPTELRIFELHQEGLSSYAIHKAVYPGKVYGGNQANEIKAVLARFGVML